MHIKISATIYVKMLPIKQYNDAIRLVYKRLLETNLKRDKSMCRVFNVSYVIAFFASSPFECIHNTWKIIVLIHFLQNSRKST